MLKKIFSAVAAAALMLGTAGATAGAQSVLEAAVVREYESAASTASSVPPPLASIYSGNYIVSDGFNVSLYPIRKGDEVWYSLNGTGFRRYTDPIYIGFNSTLKVYSKRNGVTSDTVTHTYGLTPSFSISHPSGAYNGPQRIFLNCGTQNTKLYYTLDGSIPNENSAVYSSSTGILIGKSSALNIVAVRTGWNKSYRSYTYAIIGGQNVEDDPYADGGLIIEDPSVKKVSVLDDYENKWGYNRLTTSQKAVYEKLFEAAEKHTEKIDVSSLRFKASEFDKVYWAFDYDNPQFLALGSGYSYYYYQSTGYLQSVIIRYGRTDAELISVQQMFNATSKRVIEEAKKQTTDYAKLKYIHDWIVNNTDYTLTGPAYKSEADGVIVFGKALCEGYSKAFMYLAQELGFECICVVGKANGSAHMWNMVKLNGAWYHVDATFDDPIMSDGSRALTHDYFLVGTSKLNKTHTIDNPISVPTATRSY